MTATREQYDEAFAKERLVFYPEIVEVERRLGYAIDRFGLEDAARVLACPVKVNPPNWQHGRLIFAAARKYISTLPKGAVPLFLDIGTAKGFSALCMQWACEYVDGPVALDDWNIVSLDVIDPGARIRRNTVAEVDKLKTLAEILAPWPETLGIKFIQSTGVDWLRRTGERVHFAFIDGKHTFDAVDAELRYLSRLQRPGDVAILDDMQIPGVRKALYEARGFYTWSEVALKAASRAYALATRK